MATRRGFLGSGIAVTGKALVGSYLLNEANILVPNTQLSKVEPDPKEIVVATEVPPEPLGWVGFQWAKVELHRDMRTYQEGFGTRPFTVADPSCFVRIEGYAQPEDVHRETEFFQASQRGETLRIYFAKDR